MTSEVIHDLDLDLGLRPGPSSGSVHFLTTPEFDSLGSHEDGREEDDDNKCHDAL